MPSQPKSNVPYLWRPVIVVPFLRVELPPQKLRISFLRAETQDNSFENLIALCPNCHTRFDQKKEIDRQAVKMYKHNLGILNNRYGEFERRLFEVLAKSNERVFVLGAAGYLWVANAVKDGFFEDKHVEGMGLQVNGSNGFSKNFPMSFTYWVTDAGVEFIKRFASGIDIA